MLHRFTAVPCFAQTTQPLACSKPCACNVDVKHFSQLIERCIGERRRVQNREVERGQRYGYVDRSIFLDRRRKSLLHFLFVGHIAVDGG